MVQIKLNNDFPIDIATAHSRMAKKVEEQSDHMGEVGRTMQ